MVEMVGDYMVYFRDDLKRGGNIQAFHLISYYVVFPILSCPFLSWPGPSFRPCARVSRMETG